MPVFAGGLADFVASIPAITHYAPADEIILIAVDDHDSWAAYDDTDNTSSTEEN